MRTLSTSKFSLSLLVLGIFVSIILHHLWSKGELSIINKYLKSYDYIIVGAGTCGSVIASRLSENPNVTVLLIESGAKSTYFSNIPMMPIIMQKGPQDWSYYATTQKYSSFGMWNQSQYMPRGMGLGGSGQINYLMHGLGLKEDYDNWCTLGASKWNYKEMLPYFKKVFASDRSDYDSFENCPPQGKCSSREALIKLKRIPLDNELLNVFRLASEETAHNGRTIFWPSTSTVFKGKRDSTLKSYLQPNLQRKNLHVLLNTMGVMVGFSDKTASSLYILKNKILLDNIFVKKEIILSAGAINTPQILMLSGIGPKNVLEKHNINPVAYLEGVGENLHDTLNMPLYVSIKTPISVTLEKIFTMKTIWNYLWKGEGLLSLPPVAGTEIIDNDSALILFALGSTSEKILKDLSNYKTEIFRELFPYYNNTGKEGFVFLATCIQPISRGNVRIKDDKIGSPPQINPNYLSEYSDVSCMIKAIRRAFSLLESKAFRDIGAEIHWPQFEGCQQFWDASIADEYLECIVRHAAVTGHHAGGTCSMSGKNAVVDETLRVRGIEGLRVIDASILPSPISLFPNSVLIAMVEKAVDIIKGGLQIKITL